MKSPNGYGGEIKTELDGVVFTATGSGDEILKLTDKGMYYKNEFVNDAGEVHRLILDWLGQTANKKEKE